MLYPNPQIYHHLKTIFVHVPKAAGTSIEKHLRKTDKDVVGGHTTALAYRRKYPEEFATYFKFAVVRDPVDRFVSAYSYLKQMAVHAALNNQIVHNCESMGHFVEKAQASPKILTDIVHLMPQHQFVCDQKGEILVDSVFRYENLENAWREICKRIGIPPDPLAKLNPSRRVAKEEITEDVVSLVRGVYARDYEIFAYCATPSAAESGNETRDETPIAARPQKRTVR